ncbi:hypothetical protein A6X21_06850 [Planctopirus hydrillae]|uniref:Uncharacterized protein n=1 Tax=Planctopirus hydrillae TaxID=1841610 RepID=A0A1C3EA07_9PLAN|nr:hypothetical protein A6X21_06850 [Planctopirus hydrillae]
MASSSSDGKTVGLESFEDFLRRSIRQHPRRLFYIDWPDPHPALRATLSHADAGEGLLLLLPFRREKAGMRASSNELDVQSTNDLIAGCLSSLATRQQSAPLRMP